MFRRVLVVMTAFVTVVRYASAEEPSARAQREPEASRVESAPAAFRSETVEWRASPAERGGVPERRVPATLIEDSVQRVTLEQALQMFEENNLELRLATSDRDRASGHAKQARAYPNPVFLVTHEDLSEKGVDYSESYFMLSQRLEWPGRRGPRAEAADEEVAARNWALEAQRRRLAFEVKRAFIEAAAAEERMAVVVEVRDVFRMADASVRERLRAGDMSGYDARRLRIERARYENLAASADIEFSNVRLRLASLILPGEPGEQLLEIAPTAAPKRMPPFDSEMDIEAAVALALEQRPEMRRARARMASADASIRHLASFKGPDVTLTGGYKRQSDGFDGFFVGATLPIPAFDRRQGDLEAAGAALRGAQANADLTRRSIETDVRRALAAYTSLSERAELLGEELLSGVDDLLQIARVSYREGEMSLLEVLDAAEAFRESQIMRSQLKAELWIRYYDLERAVGGAPFASSREINR